VGRSTSRCPRYARGGWIAAVSSGSAAGRPHSSAAALVRTLLFVVSVPVDGPALLLVPPLVGSVIGVARSVSEPRSAAVRDAQRMAAVLPLAETVGGVVCLPAFETIPSAGVPAMEAAVDRVVALPFAGSLAVSAVANQHPLPGWCWVTLGAITCAAVYALAALAINRVRTYFPSSSRAVMRALESAPALWRSGAREQRRVKRTRLESSGTATPGKLSCWRKARARMLAADQALVQALLAVPDSDPMAADLHAFADLVRPLNEEEVPPSFRLDGGLPTFTDPGLFMAPFSMRVQPPCTQWLPLPPQPEAPSDFDPESLQDLLYRVVR